MEVSRFYCWLAGAVLQPTSPSLPRASSGYLDSLLRERVSLPESWDSALNKERIWDGMARSRGINRWDFCIDCA